MNNKCTLFICQDGIQKFTTWPKCHNTCKQVGSLAFLAIPGLPGTVVPLFYSWHYSCFARMSTSPSMSSFETIHFLTGLWQVVTLSPYWWLLWYQVQLLLSYTAPCHLHTILWTGACYNHTSSTGTLVWLNTTLQ